MVWSELGTSFPKAGGSYNFLKETYGPKRDGALLIALGCREDHSLITFTVFM